VGTLAEQNELQTMVAKRVFAALRTVEWSRAELFWSRLGGSASGWVKTYDAPGGAGRPRNFRFDHAPLEALKKAMFVPGAGTWFSVTMTVTPEGRFAVAYNYDRRVYWDVRSPSPFDKPDSAVLLPTDDNWLDEFERYPRDPEHLPAFAAGLKRFPREVHPEPLRRAIEATVGLPADLAALADDADWAGVTAVIADSAVRRLSAGEYPVLLQDPPVYRWLGLDNALKEDVHLDAVNAILADGPDGAEARARRLYAALPGDADAATDLSEMWSEVQSVIARLAEADVTSRIRAAADDPHGTREALSALAARARMKEMRPRGDEVFVVSDMEVDYAIARTGTGAEATFRVQRRSRGGSPVVLLDGADRAAAERHLTTVLASDVRLLGPQRP